MSKLKLIPILLLVALFSYTLSLPSTNTLPRTSKLQEQLLKMNDFDYLALGIKVWTETQSDDALSILDIAATGASGEFAQAEKSEYYDKLSAQTSKLAELQLIGQSTSQKKNSWDTSVSASLADFFHEKSIDKLSAELLLNTNNFNKFLITLNKTSDIVDIMPKSKPAFDILKIAEGTQCLTGNFKNEIADSIEAYNKSEEINPALLEEVLAKVIPVWQLMKRCDTWSSFSTLIKQVKTSKHASILLELANDSDTNTMKLSYLLLTAQTDTTLAGAILGYINDYGTKGINNLYKAIRKGPKGLKVLINNPGATITDLNGDGEVSPGPVRARWITISKTSPLPMEFVRYFTMSITICVIIMIGVSKQHLARVMLVKDPENAPASKICGQLFLVVFAIFAISFIFNTFLGEQTDIATGVSKVTDSNTVRSAAAQIQPQNVLSGMSILSLVIIIFIQFTVYAKAISELKKIKDLTGSAQLKLKQLKHADIFFDLPIYLGLLGTVSSFIIMLFDPGASRIVAYTSTIIGIIFSASLRIFYMYPFQKELTNETEKIDEPMVG